MRVTIYPSTAKGCAVAPPSKSMAHRLLIAGAFSERSCIENVAYSQDILATLDCLEALGAAVKREENRIHIGGLDPYAIPSGTVLPCRESGSTLRFLIPLCLLSGRPVTFTGAKRLFERPLTVYEDLCKQQGFLFEKSEDSLTVCGTLTAGDYAMPGDVSSQFITGMLFALSLLKGESRLQITGAFESASYIELTVQALSAFSVTVFKENNTYSVTGNQRYLAREIAVEGDYSNAAYLEGLNLLGGDVKVNGLSPETAQGDKVYRDFFENLKQGHRHFDLSDCPDLGPVVFALAAAYGGAVFTGIARLRMKESDRVNAMVTELSKFGVTAVVDENRVEILSGDLAAPQEMLCGHNDHRVVMALSLLCSITGGTIDGAEAVTKSYPNYFQVIQALGIEMNCYDTK